MKSPCSGSAASHLVPCLEQANQPGVNRAQEMISGEAHPSCSHLKGRPRLAEGRAN